MAQCEARTVSEYLQDLPAEKREVVARVRSVILENLPEGYRETVSWGMIAYEVPLARYPITYNKKPLLYMALAAQKNHFAVYATGVYMKPDGEAWVRSEFEKAGKRVDMGKSCIRFRKLEDLPLDVIGKIAGEQSVEAFLEAYERVGRRK